MKKAIDIFRNLVELAWGYPDMHKHRFKQPGDLIKLLSEEDRETLANLKPEDIVNVTFTEIKWASQPFDYQYKFNFILSEEKMKFDKNLIK